MRPALVTVLLVALLAASTAQQAPPPARVLPPQLIELVKKQFGPAYSVVDDFAPVLLTADLNGDGVEDAVIVGRCKNPLVDAKQFGYRVLDPHHAFFGFGDPKVTYEFNLRDPLRNRFLLVIHGAGEEGWRAATPKEKFVLINVPFDRLTLGRILVKKKILLAISAEETSILTSAVYWDGKKYKWEPNTLPAGEPETAAEKN
ncbi:MAG: hypothetical protein L0099_05695 [Acidobacteria bacterium]|nr:hypothetical protein [Acidobacteriota bacterium]